MNYSRETLPAWAQEMIALYESDCASQFILHGNIHDRFLLGSSAQLVSGTLPDFLKEVLMPQFDVVLSYDLGNGLRVERGGEKFKTWPPSQLNAELPKAPRPAIELITRYLRYSANLARLKREQLQVGVIIQSANLVAPAIPGILNYDLNALALLLREWGSEEALRDHPMATCLLTENLNDLHPIVANNPRAARIKLSLPTAAELETAIGFMRSRYPTALHECASDPRRFAQSLTGITLNSLDRLFRLKEYKKEALTEADLSRQRRVLVEEECQGLIEFVESKKTLDDLYGQEKVKAWLRQDLALWRQRKINALPMGYLLCGPVGTGKTFLVECLAGEAGVPVVKIKNFRDRWVGSTEGNLEKIFRFLQALDRCYVFVDEADQALGKRDTGATDSGLSGRIYSMVAGEMSRPDNRGRVVWVLASSRPDLIEVDLKRPGRIDVKVPLFPTTSAADGFQLVQKLGLQYSLEFGDRAGLFNIPDLLTPGTAEALVVKAYRLVQTEGLAGAEALARCLEDYQSPVSREAMELQIRLAIQEASDMDFVPAALRERFGRQTNL